MRVHAARKAAQRKALRAVVFVAGLKALPFHPRRASARSIVPPGLCNFRSRIPALRFAACRANYNRASLRRHSATRQSIEERVLRLPLRARERRGESEGARNFAQDDSDRTDVGGRLCGRKPSPREGGVSYISGGWRLEAGCWRGQEEWHVQPSLRDFAIFVSRIPALRFAACRANYNRASGADVLEARAGGWMLERASKAFVRVSSENRGPSAEDTCGV